ncbi:PQQ-binding-like beta-propeller repeat protein [Rubripirellula obstinata]|uniref:outer membrane protein assembly factor BamB family protein n=1 Tax=Rubripirellula obstinata TaxID=406547 RepID=UPI00135ABB7A|nr:PQQ-binding-like beta-propeller repeat protein [Rubripirellula obstinata]
MKSFRLTVFVFSCVSAVWGSCCWQSIAKAEEPWRQFRGPDRSGVAASDEVTFDLSPGKNVVWRTETKHVGWSSPITDGKRLWMTSARTVAATPEQKAKKLEGATFAGLKDVVTSVDIFAVCLDVNTGEIVHHIRLDTIESPNSINPMNSFASPTGVWSGDRVVLHFGRYGTYCLNANTGDVIWKERLIIDDSVGPGSSLAIHDGIVVIPCDGMDVQYVAGLSLQSGEVLWKTSRPNIDTENGEFRKAYSTPLLIEVNGKTQAVVPGSQWCVAYDAVTGSEIWRVDHGKGFSVSPTPVYADGKVIFSTGYGGKELMAVDPTGTGDVTDTHIVWRSKRGASMMPSAAVIGSQIYSIAEGGILAAVNLDDGSLIWKKRLGGKYSSSPLVSGNRLLIADHDGNVTVIEPGKKYNEIARYELGEQIMASPIPIGNDLILRTAKAVYRFTNSK